jgi:hypothetical protein
MAEEHDLCSSEGDDRHSVSQESSGEMNRDMNFTSSNGLMLHHCGIQVSGGSSFPKLFVKAPMGRFYLRKFVQRVAYEELKFKDGIDMEVQVNLDFVNYD